MKYLVKFFVVTLLILISTHAFAEQKIMFMDLKFILNNSKAGKGAQTYLKNTFNDNQKKLAEIEKKLKKGLSIDGLISLEVKNYINNNKLYT